MALTHVCMWEEGKGYCHVTAEEAAKQFPDTVRADSRIFICELCGEWVLFTKSGDGPHAKERHFRHARSEETKACEDRQVQLESLWNKPLTSLGSHTLPVQIRAGKAGIRFAIGFPAIPEDGETQSGQIVIRTGAGGKSYVYNIADRMGSLGITYLEAGELPAENYILSFLGAFGHPEKYWPSTVKGVQPSGTFFEVSSHDPAIGKMILPQRKISAQKSYYFLKKEQINPPSDMKVEKIYENRQSGWYLYRIQDIHFTRTAAQFFLKYGLFLTESPVDVYPLWPVFWQSPYIFCYQKHTARQDEEFLYFFIEGEHARVAMYPQGKGLTRFSCGEGSFIKFQARERAQLVSLGNSGALGYFYLIQTPMHAESLQAEVSIRTDKEELQKKSGREIYHKLPPKNRLWVRGIYDGKIVRRHNGCIGGIYFLKADTEFCIRNIQFTEEIEIWQGLCCIRILRFERARKINENSFEKTLLAQLQACRGEPVPVPHSIGAAAAKWENYPQLKQWLLTKIRSGQMPGKAYQILTAVLYKNR